MPIFFQHQVDDATRLGIWKIEETEDFFKDNVPQHRDVTHPHKRLQHLAGRFLLRFLFPDFPYELIQIADTRKPYLPNDQYHFSISHCGDYAAAIVSKRSRVGIDIEIPMGKIVQVQGKFLSLAEKEKWSIHNQRPGIAELPITRFELLTLLWSSKEAVYKWYGDGGVDFRQNIQLKEQHEATDTIDCFFSKNNSRLLIHYRQFGHLVLAWVVS